MNQNFTKLTFTDSVKQVQKEFGWNCRQHITPRYTIDEIAQGITESDTSILSACNPAVNKENAEGH